MTPHREEQIPEAFHRIVAARLRMEMPRFLDDAALLDFQRQWKQQEGKVAPTFSEALRTLLSGMAQQLIKDGHSEAEVLWTILAAIDQDFRTKYPSEIS